MWWLLMIIPGLLVVGYFRDLRRDGAVKARRGLLQGITCVAVLYCAVLGTLLLLENWLLFQPISFETLHEDTSALKYEEVKIPSSDGNTLVGWWCPQEGAQCTILYCHGTGGNLTLHTMIVPMLQKTTKVNVLAIAYPGYSGSTGSPSEAGCYAAGEAAYDWLTKTRKIRPDRVLLLGQSLGGGVACELAQRRPHAGLILLSSFTTLPERAQEVIPIFPITWLMRNQFDNRSKLERYEGPLLIAHGDNDDVVPFHHGEQLYVAAASTRKEFHRIRGGTHVVFDQAFFRKVGVMVESLVK